MSDAPDPIRRRHCCCVLASERLELVNEYSSFELAAPLDKSWRWRMDCGGGQYLMITYCPWCGERLQTRHLEAVR